MALSGVAPGLATHCCTNSKCGHGSHCEDDNGNTLAIILPLLIVELTVEPINLLLIVVPPTKHLIER